MKSVLRINRENEGTPAKSQETRALSAIEGLGVLETPLPLWVLAFFFGEEMD